MASLFASGCVTPVGSVVLSISGIAGGPLVTSRAFGASPASGDYSQVDYQPNPGAWTIYVDSGDGLPGPLPNTQGAYNYFIQDSATGVFVTGLAPIASISVEPDWLDETILGALRSGITNLSIPTRILGTPPQTPALYYDMPRVGFPSLPFVFFTPMSMQQVETQIGQDLPEALSTPGRQLETISVQVSRTYRQTVFARTATEREFYRDSVLGIWQVILATILQPLGKDLHHTFMVHSTQDAEGPDKSPGFYEADILYSFQGTFNAGIVPVYGTIEAVSVAMTGSLGVAEESETGYSVESTSVTGAMFTTVVSGED